MRRVYLDHNATTPLRREARELFLALTESLAGNPSSLHQSGRAARLELDRARERTAAALGVHEDEIVFTSGGTEANNLALAGVAALYGPRSALVTSSVEHSSVLEACAALERSGHRVARVGVDARGIAAPEEVAAAAAEIGAVLVAIMAANNEVGTLMPLAEIAAALERPAGPLFFTDAVQALGRAELRLEEWGIDLASFSFHKLGGPLGAGVLFRRRGVGIAPMAHGGGQEGGLRPGTENVAAIAAGALALELAVREREVHARRLHELAAGLWNGVRESLRGARLVGPPIDAAERLPGTVTVLVPHVDGKVLVTRLDLAGLEASAGSACASGSLEPSHVLLAMGFAADDARAALRLSLGRSSTWEDVHSAVEILRKTLG